MKIKFGLLALASCLMLSVPTAHAVESTFDTGPDGWFVADWTNPDLSTSFNTYSVTWHSTGGNPNGHISASDTTSGGWFWFAAPAKYFGNQVAAFGTSLRYDISVNLSNGQPGPIVMLTGAGQRLFFNGDSPSPALQSVVVPLLPIGWKLNDWQNGAMPTAGVMQSILSNLDGLYISGDWLNGIEVASLDNVSLVPEPTSSTLLLLGAISVGALFGKRATVSRELA